MGWVQGAGAALDRREPTRAPGTIQRSAVASMDEDAALIRQFRGGCDAAFDQLYSRHQEFVYNVCLGVLANPDDARDCTQETFLRAYRKLGDFRGDSQFSTWLYRVAVNVCVGQLRRRPRQAPASLEEEQVREIPAEVPAAWTGPVREADERLVREIVGELSPDYRTVLVLRYFQDLSYEEMLGVLGYNMSQLKVKLHRARRAFARRWMLRLQETEGAG